jgi:hypothetical protein
VPDPRVSAPEESTPQFEAESEMVTLTSALRKRDSPRPKRKVSFCLEKNDTYPIINRHQYRTLVQQSKEEEKKRAAAEVLEAEAGMCTCVPAPIIHPLSKTAKNKQPCLDGMFCCI